MRACLLHFILRILIVETALVEFRFEIGSDTDCMQCDAVIPLTSEQCPGCGRDAPYRITFEDFFSELEGGRILDARPGGLIIGRDGPEDDIPMYRHERKGIFQVVGLMQGGEFIVSSHATSAHRVRLEEINGEKGAVSSAFSLNYSIATSVINTNLMPQYGGLWIGHYQFVINRFATAKYLEELEWLNLTANADNLGSTLSK